jgi:hypothetical protein
MPTGSIESPNKGGTTHGAPAPDERTAVEKDDKDKGDKDIKGDKDVKVDKDVKDEGDDKGEKGHKGDNKGDDKVDKGEKDQADKDDDKGDKVDKDVKDEGDNKGEKGHKGDNKGDDKVDRGEKDQAGKDDDKGDKDDKGKGDDTGGSSGGTRHDPNRIIWNWSLCVCEGNYTVEPDQLASLLEAGWEMSHKAPPCCPCSSDESDNDMLFSDPGSIERGRAKRARKAIERGTPDVTADVADEGPGEVEGNDKSLPVNDD